MSASSGYPALFPPSTSFPPSTFLPPPSPPRSARDLVAAVYRQLALIGGCTALVAALAAGLHLVQPPLYASTAKVWVPAAADPSAPAPGAVPSGPAAQRLEAEIELMQSHATARAVVDRLGIEDRQLTRPPLAVLRTALHLGGDGHDPDRTAELFLRGLRVVPMPSRTGDGSAAVLALTFECTDRALAPRALQAFIDEDLRRGDRRRREVEAATAESLALQVGQARVRWREAEEAIVALLVDETARGASLAAAPAPSRGEGLGAEPSTRLHRGLRLDLEPLPIPRPAATSIATSKAPLPAPAPAPRPDETRTADASDAWSPRDDGAPAVATPAAAPAVSNLQATLHQIEQRRDFARARTQVLQRRLDQVELALRTDPPVSTGRYLVDVPDRPAEDSGRRTAFVATWGPLAGLLLGLLLAGLREFGGDRLRSAREAEWALGAPVLGALPTLSQRARSALLGPAFDPDAAAEDRPRRSARDSDTTARDTTDSRLDALTTA
jgi:uncharacterized protein involved in exopolysaccharide biosynthesis